MYSVDLQGHQCNGVCFYHLSVCHCQLQERSETELEDESKQKKDNVTHLELVEKHHKEREEADEVRMHDVSLPAPMLMYPIIAGSVSS
jgi:hypothetical protein